ncbi:hypothetical protein FBULB1_1101 [Fusarium bulbicola]|nr:hypothetical protein FBULB1_1101 [Fusarium bulbicola]
MIKKAGRVTSTIEVIDGVELTAGESLMVSYFFTLLNMYLHRCMMFMPDSEMQHFKYVIPLTDMWMLMGWFTATKSRSARRTRQHGQATGTSRKVNYEKTRNTNKYTYECMTQSITQNSIIMDSFGALDAASFIHPRTLDSADEHRHESQASLRSGAETQKITAIRNQRRRRLKETQD